MTDRYNFRAWPTQESLRRRPSFAALDAKQQLSYLLGQYGRNHLRRTKATSTLTKKARASHCFLALAELRKMQIAPKSVLNLGQKHIEKLLLRWRDRGIAPSTMAARISSLRWLALALGKPGLVHEPAAYGLDPRDHQRTHVALRDKSWTGAGLDIGQTLAEVAGKDPHVGTQLCLAAELGLRVNEALMFRPDRYKGGDSIVISQGTKGGKTRVVPIRTEAQRQAIERAKEAAAHSRRGNLVRRGQTPAQARRRVYYVLESLGISKRELGVSSHGLRHQYAADRYQQVAGEAAPVRGGLSEDLQAVWGARAVVSQELGHRRLGITSAYVGPAPRRGSSGAAVGRSSGWTPASEPNPRKV